MTAGGLCRPRRRLEYRSRDVSDPTFRGGCCALPRPKGRSRPGLPVAAPPGNAAALEPDDS